MKTLLLCTLLCLSSLTQAFAQPGLSTGVGGMVGTSWIINQNAWGNPELEYAPTVGFQYSGFIGYWINENISFQLEPGMSRMGQNYEGKMATLDARREIKLSYFTFPLLFRYTSEGRDVRFHLLAGPQLNVLTSAEHNFECALPFPYYLIGVTDVKDRFESSDIEAVLDFGADFMLSDQVFLSAGLRFNIGLKDINSENPDWRIPNNSNVYEASKNFMGGLHLGINYLLF